MDRLEWKRVHKNKGFQLTLLKNLRIGGPKSRIAAITRPGFLSDALLRVFEPLADVARSIGVNVDSVLSWIGSGLAHKANIRKTG